MKSFHGHAARRVKSEIPPDTVSFQVRPYKAHCRVSIEVKSSQRGALLRSIGQRLQHGDGGVHNLSVVIQRNGLIGKHILAQFTPRGAPSKGSSVGQGIRAQKSLTHELLFDCKIQLRHRTPPSNTQRGMSIHLQEKRPKLFIKDDVEAQHLHALRSGRVHRCSTRGGELNEIRPQSQQCFFRDTAHMPPKSIHGGAALGFDQLENGRQRPLGACIVGCRCTEGGTPFVHRVVREVHAHVVQVSIAR
mmetsp:Transcript_29526/g.78091  ORF Transcript_29526/g.78091 Transcript_29526/m.78091 type:complete len:247 (+) Transcript_29526:269-1009(+)